MSNWYQESSPAERRTFWACFSGWGLDALDVQMFGLAIPALIAAFGLSKAEAGLLGSVTLFFGAFGGFIGGGLADRFGRVKALQMTVAIFALATFACAFAQSYNQLLVLKAIQGLGFGAEWACGAVLMAEAIRAQHRGKALAAVQSAWAVGWGTRRRDVGSGVHLCPTGYRLARSVRRRAAACATHQSGAVFRNRRARKSRAKRRARCSKPSAAFSSAMSCALRWSAACSAPARTVDIRP